MIRSSVAKPDRIKEDQGKHYAGKKFKRLLPFTVTFQRQRPTSLFRSMARQGNSRRTKRLTIEYKTHSTLFVNVNPSISNALSILS